MKHKVGDKVRIKSREWYEKNKNKDGDILCGGTFFVDDMVCYCGETATITSIDKTYNINIDDNEFRWTDEMFEDDEPQVSDQLIKDIAEVIKKHNLGVCVSENDGKLIIEPLKEKKEDDLPIDTPCMVADKHEDEPCTFILRYYAGKGAVFSGGLNSCCANGESGYDIIIPWYKFDPRDLGESMKFNIVK